MPEFIMVFLFACGTSILALNWTVGGRREEEKEQYFLDNDTHHKSFAVSWINEKWALERHNGSYSVSVFSYVYALMQKAYKG